MKENRAGKKNELINLILGLIITIGSGIAVINLCSILYTLIGCEIKEIALTLCIVLFSLITSICSLVFGIKYIKCILKIIKENKEDKQ